MILDVLLENTEHENTGRSEIPLTFLYPYTILICNYLICMLTQLETIVWYISHSIHDRNKWTKWDQFYRSDEDHFETPHELHD